jgi:predicted AAA+ superfamily ATPase
MKSNMHTKRFLRVPKQSFFLFGPRGSGKTTWLKEKFPDALFINLLEPEEFRIYQSKPERLKNTIEANKEKKVIVIDEIQHIPELLPLVHSLMEENKELQFVLTGSSARKLRRVGTDLLAGRAIREEMHPYIASELEERFSLEKALELGMLPLVWEAIEPLATLKTYITIYLKEEVQAEGIVRHIGNFSRFLEVMSFSHAMQLNASNIARECQVSRSTTNDYIQILKDLLLGYTLDVFSRRAIRALSSHSKFYYFDAGVFKTLRPRGPLDRKEEIEGPALEGLIMQHLRAWLAGQSETHTLHFWRTRSGVEVDFIVYGPRGFWAIEVKNSSSVSPKDVQSLQTFCEEYPECTPLFLYRGKGRTVMNNILCLPCTEFLLNIKVENPLWAKTGNSL